MTRFVSWLAAGMLGAGLALAGASYAAGPGGESAIDLSAYQTKAEAAAALAAMQAAVAAMQNAQAVKQTSIPTAGPGAGLCRQTIVPSELVTSGGITGTPGTCSRILQCGTSATYVVTQFNVGSGC